MKKILLAASLLAAGGCDFVHEPPPSNSSSSGGGGVATSTGGTNNGGNGTTGAMATGGNGGTTGAPDSGSCPADTTMTDGGFSHVLLISIDGMHAVDLANWVKNNPNSTLATLASEGTTYSNDSTPRPSDSFPGLISMVTGGSPVSTGIWYDVIYDRALSPPQSEDPDGGSYCPSQVGTLVAYDETLDDNLHLVNAGGGINPTHLPRDPKNGCAEVWPHQHLRVNTIFEIIKAAGLRTAWSDKHPAYEIVNGPSGTGVDDLYTPEVNSDSQIPGEDWTEDLNQIQINDELKVQAILHQINGLDSSGASCKGTPAIFGMDFQAVSVGQKLVGNGYADVLATPTSGLNGQLQFVDQSLGQMVQALTARNLMGSTLIIIGSKHGQSPIDVNKHQAVADSQFATILSATPVAQGITGNEGLVDDDWAGLFLQDQSQTNAAVETLSQPANEAALGIKQIYAGELLKTRFNDPLTDSRTPDIIIETNYGVIYTGGTKIAEHGGVAEDDMHVALLVAHQGWSANVIKSPVTNMQVAPTILRALGLDYNQLQAVQQEFTSPLPGLNLINHATVSPSP